MQQPIFNINITINNNSLKVSLSKIRTVLHLSLLLHKSKKVALFIEIPRFCFHPRLPIAGNCRMCLIELFKAPKLVVACTTRIQDGMVIFTNSLLVKKAREFLLEFFLANHPLDCPICDQGGECDLQNQLEVFGLDHTRYTENIKKVAKVINMGVVSFQMTRCIQCTRCVRFLINIADTFDLGIVSRGSKMKISKYINTYLFSEFLSNIVDLCPVGLLYLRQKKLMYHNKNINKIFYYCGALTTTHVAYRTRSWELYSKYTIDILDNIGADVRIDLKGTDIMRVLPRLNHAVNDYWITEITRYSMHGLKVQRLLIPYYKNKLNKYVRTNWATLLDIYAKYTHICGALLKKKISEFGATGNLIDSKTALSLRRFLQSEGSSELESRAYQNQELLLDCFEMFSLNAESFKRSSLIFLIGVNLRLEAPFYNLKIKKKKNLTIFTCGCGTLYNAHNFININNVRVLNLGLSIKSLLKVLEGRAIFSTYIEQVLKTNEEDNLLFLLGSAVSQRKDILNIINMCYFYKLFQNYKKQKKVFINVLQPHIGRITAQSINLIPGRNALKNNNTLFLKNKKLLLKDNLFIFYNKGLDDFRKLTESPFCYNMFYIFMGHTIVSTAAPTFDVLLPTCTFLEKETLYLNVEGVLRESKIVIAPYLNINVLSDWHVSFLFLKKKYIFAKSTYKKKLKKVHCIFNFNKIVPVLDIHKYTKISLFKKDFLFFKWVFFITKQITFLKFSKANSFGVNFKNLIITVYFQKFIHLFTFTKTLFKTANIDAVLTKQLLTFSRLFCLKNQYSSKNDVNFCIRPILFNIRVYLVNFPIVSKYRGYFVENIISKNTIDLLKIKNNLNALASNYI